MIKRIVIVLVGTIVLGLAVVGVLNMAGFNPFQSQRTDRSQPALLKSIKDISQYHAAVGNFETVLDIEDNVAGIPTLITGRRTLFVAAGTVDAYVDLSGFGDNDLTLSADGKSVTVRLPEPQLDKPNLDHERSYVFSQDRGVLDRIADAVEAPKQAEFFKLAETKLASAAEESKLRQQAAENTKSMLTGMFSSLKIEATFL
ncbi:DUF4230 domain-containing protein [Arthrobacter sp. SLBN-122]|uniref:DUF4230 domain-containing protein n=1 Tax=Arthrobacter sp. SLBN-122 TaxID=2768455 RepID=UPI0011531D4C|nr:DUF4230 domain-containing protein [Arthrobacter sp. SLBN-122]TQJ36720.1 uncharacterized protein DUF4230 [Arthrobacter sp. SLBN-122]